MTYFLLGCIDIDYHTRRCRGVFLDKTTYRCENIVNDLNNLRLICPRFGRVICWYVFINDRVESHIPGVARMQSTSTQNNVVFCWVYQAAWIRILCPGSRHHCARYRRSLALSLVVSLGEWVHRKSTRKGNMTGQRGGQWALRETALLLIG